MFGDVVTMNGAERCGDCLRSEKFLYSNNISYNYGDLSFKFKVI
jgi:glutaredoxin-related protein